MALNEYQMQIGGVLRNGEEQEIVTNPFDGSPVGKVHVGGEKDMEDAIASAVDAFSRMRVMPTHERAALLTRIAGMVTERREELAQLMMKEGGKPITYARGEVDRAVMTFTLGAEEARRLGGEVQPIDIMPGGEGRLCMFRRVPRGPVAAISPFNFPLNLIAHKLSPAIAAGTTMVLKPPAQTPLTAHVLGEICQKAGLPEGVFNLIHCPPAVGQKMVEDPRMKVLSFTGSAALGWRLNSLAGKKQVSLELGGNAPVILDEGTDYHAVMDRLLMGAWAHAGEGCIKAQRFYVHDSIFDGFLEAFVTATEAVGCGDPAQESTMVGPVIEAGHRDRILQWVEEASAGGATVHCGGRAEGQVVLPTILTNITGDMKVVCDEVFGPVSVVQPFSSLDRVIEEANAGPYGLHAGLFTRDIDKALKAFDALEFGGVIINDVPTFRADNFPYGGIKDSGKGREGVRFAVEEYTEPKVLVIRRLDHAN